MHFFELYPRIPVRKILDLRYISYHIYIYIYSTRMCPDYSIFILFIADTGRPGEGAGTTKEVGFGERLGEETCRWTTAICTRAPGL